jgi:hypothetical protein
VTSHAGNVLALSPRLFLRCGEPSGTVATDSSGLARNGTYTGVTLGVADATIGDGDTSLTFNGSTGLISVPTNANFNLLPTTGGAWSLEWLWRPNTETAATNPDIFSKSNGAAADTGFKIYYYVAAAELHYKVNAVETVVASVTNDAVWKHLVLTWNGTNLIWYLNNAATSNALAVYNPTADANPFKVGLGSGDTTKSSIDEIAVYNVALSSGQVNTLYLSLGNAASVRIPSLIVTQAVNRSYTY